MIEALQNAKTITEVIKVSRELKAAGGDIAKINADVSQRRRELLLQVNKVNTLNKIIPTSSVHANRCSVFPLKMEHLRENIIEMNEKTVIL